MKLSVIIPVYNEQDTVREVIERVRGCGVPDLEMVVVDDHSTDGTRAELESLPSSDDLCVLYQPDNRGKGAAIRRAQTQVTGDVVVIQDADLEYDPGEFPKMLEAMERFEADVVYGSRYSGREIVVDTFFHYYGNKVLTTVSNVLSNLHLTDMETCYKMIRGDLFRELELECSRFGIEPELTAKLAARRCRICEVPITYVARSYEEGKTIGWRDGVAALWYIVKYNVFARVKHG